MDVNIVEANGHKRGIWVLAVVSSGLSFDTVYCCSQMISFRMHCGNSAWLCNAVYTSSVPSV